MMLLGFTAENRALLAGYDGLHSDHLGFGRQTILVDASNGTG